MNKPEQADNELINPDYGLNWDDDPDADALAFCAEEGLVEGPDGHWLVPEDAAEAWAAVQGLDEPKAK